MGTSSKTDKDEKAYEEKMLQLKYQIDYEHWLTNQKVYDKNMVKLYEVIYYSYCSKEVQISLKEQSDFDSKVLNKPLVWMERIKMLVHMPEKAKYPFLTLIEVFASLLNFRQGEHEDLVSYLSRFKSERDVVQNLYGKEFLHGYIKRTDAYQAWVDADNKTKLLAEGMERFFVILFLRNSDQARYGNLIVKYRKAFAGQEDKYPQKLSTMIDIMRAQPKKHSTNKKPKKGDKDRDEKKPGDTVPESSFGQKDEKYACFCCKKPTCPFPDCPKRIRKVAQT